MSMTMWLGAVALALATALVIVRVDDRWNSGSRGRARRPARERAPQRPRRTLPLDIARPALPTPEAPRSTEREERHEALPEPEPPRAPGRGGEIVRLLLADHVARREPELPLELAADSERWLALMRALDPLHDPPRYVGTYVGAFTGAAEHAKQLPDGARAIAARIILHVAAAAVQTNVEFDHAARLAISLDPTSFRPETIVEAVLGTCLRYPRPERPPHAVRLGFPFVAGALQNAGAAWLPEPALDVLDRSLDIEPAATQLLEQVLPRMPRDGRRILQRLLEERASRPDPA
jgi:hypothetical protein